MGFSPSACRRKVRYIFSLLHGGKKSRLSTWPGESVLFFLLLERKSVLYSSSLLKRKRALHSLHPVCGAIDAVRITQRPGQGRNYTSCPVCVRKDIRCVSLHIYYSWTSHYISNTTVKVHVTFPFYNCIGSDTVYFAKEVASFHINYSAIFYYLIREL